MRKRVCYIHVGAHKTGTTSIQWFLQENRPELLESGYFVPESETKRGYLGKKGLADAGYCGLTTTLARRMEQELRSDNDAFAQRVWGQSWAEIFAADTAEEFTPNDFEINPPDWFTARRFRRAVREVKESVHELLLDPVLAVEAPWNDVRQRSGLVFKE